MLASNSYVLVMDEPDCEFHIPGMHFCGPGTNLSERLEKDGCTPKPFSKPVDRVDEAALRHDLFYTKYTSAKKRAEADKVMIEEIKAIKNPTLRERLERIIVIICLSIKRFFVLLFLRFIEFICTFNLEANGNI